MKDVKNKSDERISVTREEFADVTARLIAQIHFSCLECCDDLDDIAMVKMTDELLLRFSRDLMARLFKAYTLEIDKEEKK